MRPPRWRSLLYVPATSERFIAKAHTRGADAIILDLEDSVAPSEKEHAREGLAESAASVSQEGADVFVRINRPWRLAVRDIEAAVGPEVDGLVLPKVDSAEHVRAVAQVVSEVEQEQGLDEGHTVFLVRVESAAGLVAAPEIAAAHPRIAAMGLGSSDYTVETGMAPGSDGNVFASFLMVNAAVAAGVQPVGLVSTIVDFSDLGAFRADVQRSGDLGLRGAPCIHPGQVPILNEVFAPSDEELDRARLVVAEYEAAMAAGVGAITVEGDFVDKPYYDQARRLLA